MDKIEALKNFDKNILNYEVVETQDGKPGVLLTIGHTEEEVKEFTNELTFDDNEEFEVSVESTQFEILLEKDDLLHLLSEIESTDHLFDLTDNYEEE